MPELPEVETVRNMLKKELINAIIVEIEMPYSKIIKSDLIEFREKIIGSKIIDIKRRAKYLIFCFDNGYSMTSHLRMEGKYFIENKKVLHKHSHIYFKLKDGRYLIYNDTRKFGEMILKKNEDLYTTNPLNKIGLDANEETINPKEIYQKIQKNRSIKTILLDQTLISGLGNIYVDEVLFLSKIHPMTLGKNLTLQDVKKILKYSKEVLNKAIALGGTTIISFTSGHANGLFQNELLVHTKKNNPCTVCGTKIEKIKVNQRGTYYCPNCQKFFDN